MAGLFLSACGGGGPADIPGIRVEDAWARAMPGGGNSAVYLILRNEEGPGDSLLGGETPAAGAVELHRSRVQEGIVRMEEVEAVELPAGGRLELNPGGLHLMLLGLRETLVPGDSLTLTLRFRESGPLTLRIPIRGTGQG